MASPSTVKVIVTNLRQLLLHQPVQLFDARCCPHSTCQSFGGSTWGGQSDVNSGTCNSSRPSGSAHYLIYFLMATVCSKNYPQQVKYWLTHLTVHQQWVKFIGETRENLEYIQFQRKYIFCKILMEFFQFLFSPPGSLHFDNRMPHRAEGRFIVFITGQ